MLPWLLLPLRFSCAALATASSALLLCCLRYCSCLHQLLKGRQDEDEIDENESVEETWEIMVCHGNVIRCSALLLVLQFDKPLQVFRGTSTAIAAAGHHMGRCSYGC